MVFGVVTRSGGGDALRGKLILGLVVVALAPYQAWAQNRPKIAIDLDPSTPTTIDSARTFPGAVASFDVGIIVNAQGTAGIGEVGRVAFGATNAFNPSGAIVTGITSLSIVDLIPGAPAGTFQASTGEFEFGLAAQELGNGSSFSGGPVQWIRFRLTLGSVPPGSRVRVFVGDAGVGSSAVKNGAGALISGDATRDATPVFGTAASDQEFGAGVDYIDAVATFGTPPACSAAGAPLCRGTCPAGQYCYEGTDGNGCHCVPGPSACGSAAAPECDGSCPAGSTCSQGGGGACACVPEIGCGQESGAECHGTCPSGQVCGHPDDLGESCACITPDPLCSQSSPPTCGGECREGYQCANDGQGSCRCLPVPTSCAVSAAPACGGACPPYTHCRADASGTECSCVPNDSPCIRSSAPACGGRCSVDTQMCVPDASGLRCVCRDVPCGQSPYPECGGTCAQGFNCLPDTVAGTCVCRTESAPCGSSQAPQCEGACPAGQTCQSDLGGASCQCAPVHVACGSATAPLCAGSCPEGEDCHADATGTTCSCSPPTVTCGAGPAPACGAFCSGGFLCQPTFFGTSCECVPEPSLCEDTAQPACGGRCPTGSRCDVSVSGGCACKTCDEVVPSSRIEGRWSDKTHYKWNVSLDGCAQTYNLYRATVVRLVDANHDGLADNYGSCFQSGLTSTQATDSSKPPAGQMHTYLVTGKDAFGEGSAGTNSTGATRPHAPCP